MVLNMILVQMKPLKKTNVNRVVAPMFSLLFASVFMLGCANAQEKEITIQVFNSDENKLESAEIRVVTTTGDENIYSTNEKGIVKLTLDCEVGYFITCDYKSHHKEKIKLMKPCMDLEKDIIEVHMKSNLISH